MESRDSNGVLWLNIRSHFSVFQCQAED